MTPDTDTEARAAAEAYAKAWSDPDAQTWVIEAFLAGRARGLEEAAGIADAEAVSEFSWAKKYQAEKDDVSRANAEGGHAAAQEIAQAIRAAAKGEGK